MAIQFKRGTTGNRTNYTPAAGELIVVDVDQVNPSLYVGDGSTAGGKLASASGSGGGASEAFKTISVAGQDNIIAELTADTLTFSEGANITLTTNASTDTLTITNSYSAPAETDPVFSAHDASNVTSAKITSWDTAFGWGDHALSSYLSGQSSINALTDVDTTTTGPTQNQVLAWSGNKWIPATSTAGTTLSGLSDTNTSNASSGKILEYDNGTWVIGEKTATGATTVIGLSDTPTNYTSKANFFVRVNPNATGIDFRDITASLPLSWDKVNSVLSFSADTDDISEGATNLYYTDARVNTVLGTKTYLEDTDFTSQGIMLRGSSAGSYSIVTDSSANWNTAYGWGDHSSVGYLTSISALSINALSDVTITSATNTQILRWDGSNWVNSDEVISISLLTGLTDTPSSYGTSGQVLSTTGTGTQWIDQSAGSGGGLQDISDDFTPQLGGDFDVQARTIFTSTTDGNIVITPNGTGHLEIGSANIITTGDIITTGKVYFGNTFTNLVGLPSATTYDGMVAIADDTGNIYYSHNTAWAEVAKQSDVPTVLTDLGISDSTAGYTLTTNGSAGFTFTNIREGTAYYTNGNFGINGDSKSGKYIYRGITTNGNQNEIFIGDVVNSRLNFQSNSINTVEVLVTGTKTATLGGASFKLEACFKNTAGVLTILGTVNKTRIGFTNSTYNALLDVDTNTNKMRIRCKGATSHNIRWMAVVNTVEVSQ
jgi:hypothetical protein